MKVRHALRSLEILVDLRRDLPRYTRRHLSYAVSSRRDRDWLQTPQVVRVAPRFGKFSLEVVPEDEIGRFLYVYGLWDLQTTRFLLHVLESGMTMLDIGANVGYLSLLAAERIGPDGLVHSFEPDREIRGRLERNIARNGLSNIVVRKEAVTKSSGEVRFFKSAEASNQGISSTVEGPGPHGERRETEPELVPAVRLDDVAISLDRPVDVVKLDVEGAELDALEGGGELLGAPAAPLVIFEAYELGPVAEAFEALGFTVRRLVHDRRRGVRLDDPRSGTDVGEPNYVAYKEHHAEVLADLV